MTRRIYLPIEIQARELDVRLDLAGRLMRLGWEVVIGRFNDVVAVARRHGGGVLFYKAHSDFVIRDKLLPAKEAGARVVALDEEGLIFPSADWYLRHRIGTGAYLDHLDAIFTWGPLQHDILASRFPQVRGKLHMTGNERLVQRPRATDRTRDIILVNTNFGPANLSPTIGKTYLEMVEDQRVETGLADRRFLESRQDYYGKLVDHYRRFVRHLAEENDRRGAPFRIIFRPHPIENMGFWIRAFADQAVTVETKAASPAFFPACHAVIHTGCTTGLEAFMSGVTVLRFNPIHPKENLQESIIPNAVSRDIETPDEVFSASFEEVDREERLSPFIRFGDPSPNERQARIIDAMDVAPGRDLAAMHGAAALRDAAKIKATRLSVRDGPKAVLTQLFGPEKIAARLAKHHRWPLLAPVDIARRFGRPVRVDRIAPQVFRLGG